MTGLRPEPPPPPATAGPLLLTARYVVGHDGRTHVLYENGEVVARGIASPSSGTGTRDPSGDASTTAGR